MTEVQEMFLKAADFRIIERRSGDETAIGCRFNSAGQDFCSYIFPLARDPSSPHAVSREWMEEYFKKAALHHILLRIGCHA